MDDVSAKDWLLYGALAVGAYLLYKAFTGVVAPIAQGVSSGVSAATSGIANLWVSLTASAPMNVLGAVAFPNGSTVPIATLPIKTDGQGNVYTHSNGVTYQLQPWVTDPSSGQPVWPAVAVGS
jgi:hypothetical protein